MNNRWLAAAACILIPLSSCSDDQAPTPNERPTARIVSAPRDGSLTDYTPTIYWDGYDRDGVVEYFGYAITNHVNDVDPGVAPGGWKLIEKYTATFLVSADILADTTFDATVLTPVNFQRGHTFYVQATDNDGARSDPATRTFTSTNLGPVVDITSPPAAPGSTVVAPTFTFQWSGVDYIQSLSETINPESSRWMLVNVDSVGASWDAALDYARANPDAPEWSAWADYAIVRNHTVATPLAAGNYLLTVQVRDEAGAISLAIDLARNARRLVVQ